MNDLLLKRVLYGISCRNYEAAAEAIPGAIGLSSSTVSRGFVHASAAKLREMQERDLSGEDVVAMFLDGKTFADATMVVALGITISREKRFLGFVETDTENAQVLTPFLRSLLERGLDISEGLLVIIDGAKGLQAAVKKAFRKRTLIRQQHQRLLVAYEQEAIELEELSCRRKVLEEKAQQLQRRLQTLDNEYREGIALSELSGHLDEVCRKLATGLEETNMQQRMKLCSQVDRQGHCRPPQCRDPLQVPSVRELQPGWRSCSLSAANREGSARPATPNAPLPLLLFSKTSYWKNLAIVWTFTLWTQL